MNLSTFKRFARFALVGFAVSACGVAQATDWYASNVSTSGSGTSADDPMTLDDAVTAADAGDTVHLAAVTYGRTASLAIEKGVTLLGAGGDRAQVVLKRTSGSFRLVQVNHADALVANLTLDVNGNVALHGNGAYVTQGVVSNCVVRNGGLNTKSSVYLKEENAVLMDSLVTANTCYDDTVTPGVFIENGLVLRCDLSGNKSRKCAGAGWLNGAKARVFDSTIENNVMCDSYLNPGGALYVNNAGAVISNCVIRGNTVNRYNDNYSGNNYRGGGLFFAAAGKVYDSILENNTAVRDGGGVYGPGILYNCTLRNNRSYIAAGGGAAGGATLVNCILEGNAATTGGGASGAKLVNCLVTGNRATGAGGVGGVTGGVVTNAIVLSNVSAYSAEASNFDSAAKIGHTLSEPLASGAGNLTGDACWRDLAAGDYRLAPDSPCVDAGDDLASGLVTRDWYGAARLRGTHVDIGLAEQDPSEGAHSLTVSGNPGACGTATPAYGVNARTATGAIACSVTPASGWDAGNMTNFTCTGWRHVARATRGGAETVTEGAGASAAIAFAGSDDLVWNFTRRFRFTVAAEGDGSVSQTDVTLDEGGSVTLTATPDANRVFFGWMGDVPDGLVRANPATFAATEARRIRAVFGRPWYVDATKGNDSYDGLTLATAKKTLAAVTLADGDALFLAAGTHTAAATLAISRMVVVEGLGADRTQTILTGSGSIRRLSLDNSRAVVRNLTVTGGGLNIQGVTAYIASGLATNCVFRTSSAHTGQGGVYLENEDAILDGCTISEHYTGEDNCPGGINVYNGLVRNCVVSGNYVRKRGGGGWLSGPGARVFNTVFENNIACWNWYHSGGGALYVKSPGTVISNCVFRGNYTKDETYPASQSSNYRGGAIHFAAEGTVWNSVFTNNYAHNEGGAVYGPGTLYNCLLADNRSNYKSGGAACGATLVNCTVVNNSSPVCGGVSASTVKNSILYRNLCTADAENPVVSNYDSGSVLDHTCATPLAAGTGNLADDPGFRDEAIGDWRLKSASACVDAGDDAQVAVGARDVTGARRLMGEHVDLGALEYDPAVQDCELNVYGDPMEYGTSVPPYGKNEDFAAGRQIACSVTASLTDPSGLTNVACVGYEHIARTSWTATPVTNTGDSASYALPFGGFDTLTWKFSRRFRATPLVAGSGSAASSVEWVEENASYTLTHGAPGANHRWYGWTGDVPGGHVADDAVTLDGTRAHVVRGCFARDRYVDGTNGSEENDGFTAATATKSLDAAFAAANDGDVIYLAPGTYSVAETLVLSNDVTLVGLGDDRAKVIITAPDAWQASVRRIHMISPRAVLRNLSVAGGSSPIRGVTAYIASGLATNCVFRDSSALWGGGAVYLENEDAILDGCTISGHYTSEDNCPGGLHVYNGLVRNCVVSGNYVRKRGGGGWLSGPGARVFNTVFENNIACWNWYQNGGGALYVNNAGAVVSNCVFRGNRTNDPTSEDHTNRVVKGESWFRGGAIYFNAAGKVYNSVFTNNWSVSDGGAVYGPGTLYNCLLVDNFTKMRDGGATSATHLNNCTVVANRALAGSVGGVSGTATATNTILWLNAATTGTSPVLANYGASVTLDHSCASPLAAGTGNIDADPAFFHSSRRPYRPSGSSPVARAGLWSSWMIGATFLDGTPMPAEGGNVPMGCQPVSCGLLIIVR